MIIEIDNVYNMDCLEFLRQIPDDFVNHTITSPPYNFNLRVMDGKYIERSPKELINKRNPNSSKYYGENKYLDNLPIESYFEWQKKVISELLRVTSGVVFYNIQLISGNKPALMMLLGEFSKQIKEIIIWDKCRAEPAIGMGCLNSEFEFIICLDKYKPYNRKFDTFNAKRGTKSNIIRVDKNSKSLSKNKAVFSLELIYEIVKTFTQKNDVILDPFSGTGTVGVISKNLKRHYILNDIDIEFYKESKELIDVN